MAQGMNTDEERILAYAGTKQGGATTIPPLPQTSTDPTASPTQATTPADHSLAYMRQTWMGARPWAQFYSTRAISLPAFASLSDRVATNLRIFRANYQVVAAVWLCIVMLLCIPSFLLAAALFVMLDRWRAWRTSITGGVLIHRDAIIGVFAALVVVWVSGIGGHVVVSLAFSAISVIVHAALHEPDYDYDGMEIATV